MSIAIINTNSEPIISGANNDTDDEINAGALGTSGVSSAAIKDTNIGPTTGGFNNNTHNEVDANVLGILGAVIKNTNGKPTTNRANNNIDAEVNASVFMGGAINKTNTKIIVSELCKANTIIGKEIYESNLIWLLLISNRSLAPKIVPLRPLPFRQHLISINYSFTIMNIAIL